MEKIGHLLVVGQCLSISSESGVQEGVSSRSLDSSYDPGAGLSAADAILHALRRGWDQLSRDRLLMALLALLFPVIQP